jgi:hypothetical protein
MMVRCETVRSRRPVSSWMPWPGPGPCIDQLYGKWANRSVSSRGALQVTPPSTLEMTYIVLESAEQLVFSGRRTHQL